MMMVFANWVEICNKAERINQVKYSSSDMEKMSITVHIVPYIIP